MSELFASLHPPLTSFPFVLLWVVVAFDLSEYLFKKDFYKFSVLFSVVSLVAAFVAYQSGHQASQHASVSFQVADEIIGEHFLWAKISLFTLVTTVIFKVVGLFAKFNQNVFKLMAAALALATALIITWVGHLGGTLVFEHGAGVRASPPIATQ
jgi:uncharacterized membrane protein